MFVIVSFYFRLFLIYKSVLSTTKELVTFSDLILIYQSSSQVARVYFTTYPFCTLKCKVMNVDIHYVVDNQYLESGIVQSTHCKSCFPLQGQNLKTQLFLLFMQLNNWGFFMKFLSNWFILSTCGLHHPKSKQIAHQNRNSNVKNKVTNL